MSAEQKELIKTLVEEKNARDVEYRQSCMAIEAPSNDKLESNLAETVTAESCSLTSSVPAEALVEDTATPKARTLIDPKPVPELCTFHSIPTIQANVASRVEPESSQESAPSRPLLRPSSTKSSFRSSSDTLGSFSSDPSVPASLRIRDEEIQHHAMLVHSLLEEISDVQYRIDHGIRHRMHDGVLKIHWDEWAPFATKHGHDHFHRAFEQHKHVAKYWLDLREGVKPTPLALGPSRKKMVHFKDAHNRQFDLPYEQCKQWPDMMKFLVAIFENDDQHRVSTGQFDMFTEDRRIILPRFWDGTVEPGMTVSMEMQLGRSSPATPTAATRRITAFIHPPVPPAAVPTSGSQALRGSQYLESPIEPIAKDTKGDRAGRPIRNPETVRKFILATLDHWNYRLVDVTAIGNAKTLRRLLCLELGFTDFPVSFYIEAGAVEYDSPLTDNELLFAQSRADGSETPRIFVRSAPMTAVAAPDGQGVARQGTILQGSQERQPMIKPSPVRVSSPDRTRFSSFNGEALQKAAGEYRKRIEAKQRIYSEQRQTRTDTMKGNVIDFDSPPPTPHERKQTVELAAEDSSDSGIGLLRAPASAPKDRPVRPTLGMEFGKMAGEVSLPGAVTTTDTSTTTNEQWSLESVTGWLAANGFSKEWQEAFRTLNLQRSTFLEIGGANGGMYILHQSLYSELQQIHIRHEKPWHPSREREEGKRLRRLLRQIVRQDDVDDTSSEPRKLLAVDPILAKTGYCGQQVTRPSFLQPPFDDAPFEIYDEGVDEHDDSPTRFVARANDVLDQAQVNLMQDQVHAFKILSKNGHVPSSLMDSIVLWKDSKSRLDLGIVSDATYDLEKPPVSLGENATYPLHYSTSGVTLGHREPPLLATASGFGTRSSYDAQQPTISRQANVGSYMSQLPPYRPKQTTSASFPNGSSASIVPPSDLGERGRCPHPNCGKVFRDLNAHMLTHQMARPEKCPVSTCEYHVKGFARQYDRTRHAVTHFREDLICPFCPEVEDRPKNVYTRIDVFRRHLTNMHNARQAPPNGRKTTVGFKLSGEDESDTRHVRCPNPTCDHWLNSAEEVCGHIQDCILSSLLNEQPKKEQSAASGSSELPTLATPLRDQVDDTSVEKVGGAKDREAWSTETKESSITGQCESKERGLSWTVHNSETVKWSRSEVNTGASDSEGGFRRSLIQDWAVPDQDEMPASQDSFGQHWTVSDKVPHGSNFFKEVNSVDQVEERRSDEQKLADTETEMRTAFEQKVQEKEKKLQQSEQELYTRHRETKAQLERQRDEVEERKSGIEQGWPIEKQGKRKGFSLRDGDQKQSTVLALQPPKEKHNAEIEHDAELGNKSNTDDKEDVEDGQLAHSEKSEAKIWGSQLIRETAFGWTSDGILILKHQQQVTAQGIHYSATLGGKFNDGDDAAQPDGGKALEVGKALEAKTLRLEMLKEQRKRRDQERGDEHKQTTESLIDHIPRGTLDSLGSGESSFPNAEERISPVLLRNDLNKEAAASRTQSDDQGLHVDRPANSTSSDYDETLETSEVMATGLVAKGYDIPPPISKPAPIEAATAAPGASDRADLVETIRHFITQEMEMELDEIPETTDLRNLGFDSLMALTILSKLRDEYDIDLNPSYLADNSSLGDLRVSLGLDKSGAAPPQVQKHGAREQYTETVHELEEANNVIGGRSVSGASDKASCRPKSPNPNIVRNSSMSQGITGSSTAPLGSPYNPIPFSCYESRALETHQTEVSAQPHGLGLLPAIVGPHSLDYPHWGDFDQISELFVYPKLPSSTSRSVPFAQTIFKEIIPESRNPVDNQQEAGLGLAGISSGSTFDARIEVEMSDGKGQISAAATDSALEGNAYDPVEHRASTMSQEAELEHSSASHARGRPSSPTMLMCRGRERPVLALSSQMVAERRATSHSRSLQANLSRARSNSTPTSFKPDAFSDFSINHGHGAEEKTLEPHKPTVEPTKKSGDAFAPGEEGERNAPVEIQENDESSLLAEQPLENGGSGLHHNLGRISELFELLAQYTTLTVDEIVGVGE